MRDIEIVTFHVNEKTEAKGGSAGLDGVEQMRLLHRSAMLVNPGATLTVITSAKTDLSRLDVPHRRVDAVRDPGNIMLERTRTQYEYAKSVLPREEPLIFLDTDMLLSKDPSEHFSQPFDICLTWRPSDDMPFNGGVIMLNPGNPGACLRFFELFLKCYMEKWGSKAGWFGDQLAMAEVIGLESDEIPGKETHEVDGIRFSFLPCSTHNYTPSAGDLWSRRAAEKCAILHFKGSTKRFMEPYWRLHLQEGRKAGLPGFLSIAATQSALLLKRRIDKLTRKRKKEVTN